MDHAVGWRVKFGVGQLALGQRQIRFIGLQGGFGSGNVLLARADHHQVISFLRGLEAGLGGVERRLGVIQFLRRIDALGAQVADALPGEPGVDGVGARNFQVGFGFANVLGPVARHQTRHDFVLGGGDGGAVRDVGLEPPGVQRGQALAVGDPVAFLHEQGGDAFTVVEGQLRLADVHVAVKH